MPTELQVTFADGQTSDYKLPVEIWFDGNKYRFPIYGERKVEKVILDPGHALPDVNRSNNVWELTSPAGK